MHAGPFLCSEDRRGFQFPPAMATQLAYSTSDPEPSLRSGLAPVRPMRPIGKDKVNRHEIES
jgi:hypothetical protein